MKSRTSTLSRTKSSTAPPLQKTFTLKSSPSKHNQNLHSAELKQLETFVKTRSQQLDDEIMSMRNKLKDSKTATFTKSMNPDELTEDEYMHTLSHGFSKENDDIKQLQYMGNLNIQGKKLSKVDAIGGGKAESFSSKQSTKPNLKQQMDEDDFMIDFLNKQPFQQSERYQTKDTSPNRKQSKKSIEDDDEDEDGFASPQPFITSSYSMNDRLVQLLATFKLKMEDSGYTLPEFYTLLSNVTSSSHPTSRKRNTTLVTNNNVEWVSMNDFTEVLQTDLLFPLTKQDQLILLQEYGPEQSQSHKEDDDKNKNSKKTELIFHLSSFLYDAGYNHPSSGDVANNERKHDDANNDDPRLQQLLEENKALKAAQQSSSSSQLPSKLTNQITQLTSDNNKYKQELDSLGTDFFEELENLKYRYTRLEQVVGEDPYHHPISELSLEDQRSKQSVAGGIRLTNGTEKDLGNLEEFGEKSGQKIPLARLAWGSKQSMHAMDRADYGSDLVKGPKIRRPLTANHTYGTAGNNANHEMSKSVTHRGVEESVTEEEYLTRSMKAFLIPSNTASDPQEKEYHVGGLHGIGSGTYSLGMGNNTSATSSSSSSFANLCERRLAFELSSSKKPSQTVTTFIHKIREVGRSNKLLDLKALQMKHNKEEKDSKDQKEKTKEVETLLSDSTPSYITIPQLTSICNELSLQLTIKEIEILATGFGSNGKGGIECQEFIDMIQSLVYNLIGSHGMETSQPFGTMGTMGSSGNQRNGSTMTMNGSKTSTTTNTNNNSKKQFNTEFKRLIYEMVENMIQYDKRGAFATTTNIHHTLLKPFLDYDTEESGMIPYQFFTMILTDFGVLLTVNEYKLLAKPYVLYEPIPLPKPLMRNTAAEEGGISTFRNERLLAHLRGQLQVQQQPILSSFLTQHGLDTTSSNHNNEEEDGNDWIQSNTMLLYPIFVQDLTDVFEHYIASHEGLIHTIISPKLSWTLEEFHFIDHLLLQLEGMPADKRRKTLISLQYGLENADMNEEGELDGFAILSCLINSGFQLQRYHRVTLLKAAEGYGGKLDYLHLILTLLQTSMTWYQSEYHLIYKILSAMGITIEERRAWLIQCKSLLLKKSIELTNNTQNKKNKMNTTRLLASQTTLQPSDSSANGTVYDTYLTPGIFLSILSQLQVHLSPEEEARLLDCLDTEQLACQNMRKLQQKYNLHAQYDEKEGKNGYNDENIEYRKQRLWNSSSTKGNKGSKGDKRDRKGKKALYTSLTNDIHDMISHKEEEYDDYDEYDEEDSHNNPFGLHKPSKSNTYIGNTTKYRQPDHNPHNQHTVFDSTPFQTPLINYQSFLSFLSRHVGNWIYHNYTLYNTLITTIERYSSYPLQDLYEFVTLCTSFDNDNHDNHTAIPPGYIHISHFVIVCYRSNLFAHFPKSCVTELSNCLSQESEFPNFIHYKAFCIQLRGICSSLRTTTTTEVGEGGKPGSYIASTQGNHSLPINLITQLIDHTTDAQGRLSYLRNYLLLHCQYTAYHILTMKEFHTLLREFTVVYQYHELELMYLEIGYAIDISLPTKNTSKGVQQGEDKKLQVIHMKSLLLLMMKHRVSWVYTNPTLVKKILAYMKDILAGGSKEGNGGNRQGKGFEIVLEEGKISSLIQHIILRIQTFTLSSITTTTTNTTDTTVEGGGGEGGGEEGLVESYIFEYILKSMQIYLSKEDLLFLADYSDPLPEATRINPYLLYDLLSCPFLSSNSTTNSTTNTTNTTNMMDIMTPLLQQHTTNTTNTSNNTSSEGTLPAMISYDTLSEAAIYALNHLHSLCWTMAKKHTPARSAIQWIADVTCVFEGFDRTKQGYITLEEFLLALKLLNISMSWEILMNIPYIGYSPASPYAQPPSMTSFDPNSTASMSDKNPSLRQGNSLVQYKKILVYILQKNPPFGKKKLHRKKKGGDDDEYEYDEMYGDEEEEEESEVDTLQQSPTRKKKTMSSSKSTLTPSNSTTKPSSIIIQFFHILRKQLSIFILSQSSLEEIWYTVTQIFQQYDTQHTGYVTPRQFCLALGIILGEEEIVFTAMEWQEILEYFLSLSEQMIISQYQSDRKSTSQGSSSRFLTTTNSNSGKLPIGSNTAPMMQQGGKYQERNAYDGQINYLIMIEMLFEPKEMSKKLQEVKQLAATTRGGINGLAGSNALFNTKSHQYTAEGGGSYKKEFSAEEKDRASRYLSKSPASSSSSSRLRNNSHYEKSTTGSSPMKRTALSTAKRAEAAAAFNSSYSSSSKSNSDPIVKRFQQANEKYTTLLRHGKDYGSNTTVGATANASRRNEEDGDSEHYYRNKRNPNVMTTTIHFPASSSAAATTAATARRNPTPGRSTNGLSGSRVRFNATA